MGVKGFIRKYYSFSRREQRGILVLLLLIFISWILSFILGHRIRPIRVEYFNDELLALQNKSNFTESKSPDDLYGKAVHSSTFDISLFYFDPNTLDEEGWKKLGIPPRTIKSIMNYKKAGGVFKKPEDLLRIYTMHADDYQRIARYITIEKTKAERKDTLRSIPSHKPEFHKPKFSIVDLNSADTVQLQELPGIGPVFARRIWKYGQRLGGYYNKEQLLEVYGMDATRLEKIKGLITIDTTKINKIDLNQASFKDLLRHPYLEYYMVKAIAEYRQRHHGIKGVEELKMLPLMYDELYVKLKPYLSINPDYLPTP